MLMLEENRYIDTNNTEYLNFKELSGIDNCCDASLPVIINGNDGIKFSDYVPYRYVDGSLKNTITYFELPFEEYKDYGLDNCEVVKGFGCDIPPLFPNQLLCVYNAINNWAVSNRLGFAIATFAFKSLYLALKYAYKKFTDDNFQIIDLLDYCKRKNIKLRVEIIDKDNDLSEKERKEIDKGFKLLHKLYDKGLIEEAIDDYCKDGRRK